MMEPRVLYEQVHREPFVPLRLFFSTGDTWDIVRPNATFVVGNQVHLFRADPLHKQIAAEHRIVPLSQIDRVEPIADSAAPARQAS